MKTLKELREEFNRKDARLKALLSQESLSAEEQEELARLDGECEALKADIEQANSVENIRLRALQREQWASQSAGTTHSGTQAGQTATGTATSGRIAIPASVRRSKVTAFKSDENGTAQEKAYKFGMWCLAALAGRPNARKFCKEQGLTLSYLTSDGVQLAHTEGTNTAGGYLVPSEFDNELIDLREQYGVFRRNTRVIGMRSDTKSQPRRIGGLTPYFVGENTAPTESQKNWDRVSLTAKKLAVLTKYSSELDEDSVIDIGNDLAGEIAYAFANKEDECGFNGDGTSTYGGIVGVREKIKGLSNTIANIAGLHVGSGNAYSELVLDDFVAVVALLPQYADGPGAKWFMHRSFYYNVAVSLALAAGGVTEAEIIAGQREPRFLGYPVEFAQVLPKTEANSQVCAVLGDLRLAAKMGDRRQTTIAMSEHLNFAEDEIAIRGTERFDINVHDVGNADATAANRVAGPIVGLITAAS